MSKKTYLEQMQAISSDNLFDGFLGHGLFAELVGWAEKPNTQ